MYISIVGLDFRQAIELWNDPGSNHNVFICKWQVHVFTTMASTLEEPCYASPMQPRISSHNHTRNWVAIDGKSCLE